MSVWTPPPRQRDNNTDPSFLFPPTHSRYYGDSYREGGRGERSRSRERATVTGGSTGAASVGTGVGSGAAAADHYRDDGRSSTRTRKSPEVTEGGESKRSYYDDRYRSSAGDRERDRDRRDRSRH